jgi:hypothetical protein
MASTTVEASAAHMVAVLCMQVVREDPELIARLQELARTTKVPFDADKLSADVIELAEMGVTVVGQRLLTGRTRVAEFELPIPQVSNGTARAAGALAVGSFTTEFVHSSPDGLKAFAAWMTGKYPEMTAKLDISGDTIEEADQMLTLMAHVAGQLADGEGGDDDKPGEAGDAVHV